MLALLPLFRYSVPQPLISQAPLEHGDPYRIFDSLLRLAPRQVLYPSELYFNSGASSIIRQKILLVIWLNPLLSSEVPLYSQNSGLQLK